VIGYELDRYTPFRAEQVYYGYRVLARDKAAQRLAVEVILVPKEAADEALARARGLGLAVERVDVANPSGEGGSASDLLVPATGAENRSPNRPIRVLAAAAVILLIVALALPFGATQRKAAAMAEEAAALRARAQTSEGTRRELQAIRGEQDFLIERKARTPMVSDLLLEVTRLLPDDTWISEFQAVGAELTITGVTRSASGLIAALERSGVFQNTNFKSPVTTDPDGLEKFSIAAHIVEKRRP
jgi:general secretion pathway protein L